MKQNLFVMKIILVVKIVINFFVIMNMEFVEIVILKFLNVNFVQLKLAQNALKMIILNYFRQFLSIISIILILNNLEN